MADFLWKKPDYLFKGNTEFGFESYVIIGIWNQVNETVWQNSFSIIALLCFFGQKEVTMKSQLSVSWLVLVIVSPPKWLFV